MTSTAIERRRRRRVVTCTVLAVAAGLFAAACSSSKDAGSSSSSSVAPVESGQQSTSSGAVVQTSPPTNETVGSVAPDSTVAAPTTIESTTATTLPPTTTTTTTIPIVVDGAIVLVANASAVPGAAGRLTERLRQLGFVSKEPTNAAGTEVSLDASKVYFLAGADAAANSIGLVMGGFPVLRMPTPAPIVDATIGLQDATILVMLGKDLADKGLPGIDG
jgi:hypothetical protein